MLRYREKETKIFSVCLVGVVTLLNLIYILNNPWHAILARSWIHLVQANASENAETKLTNEELLAQMRCVLITNYSISLWLTEEYLILIRIDYRWLIARTILLAGHETSATTLCWIILELARHPHIQTRLRKEIRETEAAIHARGRSDFTASDLDGMSYLNAVLKVSYLQSIFLPRSSELSLRLYSSYD